MNFTTPQDLFSFYQNLLTSQQSWFTSLVNLLLSIAALFVSAQFFWNYLQLRSRIKIMVENEIKKNKELLTIENKQQIKKMLDEFHAKIKKIERLESDTILLRAGLSRNFGLLTEERGMYFASFKH